MEKSVKFYQMEFDDQHFGQLQAVKIKNQTERTDVRCKKKMSESNGN